jgi:RNA polymerase sigma-70 factor (ECF subfamily)
MVSSPRNLEKQRVKACGGMNQFEELVDAYNQPLYRFALSLVRDLDRAVELVTRTFVIWSRQEGEGVKCVKPNEGLFSTLYREHLGRFGSRVDHVGKAMLSPAVVPRVPGDLVEPLGSLEADLLPTLTLFYLQRHNYREIATILDLPIGTVMSRIARGKDQLQERARGGKNG